MPQSLVFLQVRGSGVSEVPDDPATYRCDRMVQDVEALRRHLMIERMDLIAHSQAGDLGLITRHVILNTYPASPW
jgi:pimeloyl-ACP methyl ester carboxylesterase